MSPEKFFNYRDKKHANNAIAVLNTISKVVGHLTRTKATNIAPYLGYTTFIWGTVAETAHGYWNTSVIIDSFKFYIEKKFYLRKNFIK